MDHLAPHVKMQSKSFINYQERQGFMPYFLLLLTIALFSIQSGT
jgi:hypothetical protein